MNLGIDIGNTSTKGALFEAGKLVELFLNLSVQDLRQLIEKHNPSILACKSGSNPKVEALLVDKHYLTYETPTPLKLDYQSPQTLGMDRLAACVACNAEFNGKAIMKVDLGTCLTIDFIKENTFFGGLISPGIDMRFKAMNEFTAALPLVRFTDQVQFPGKTTVESMQVGVYQSIVNEITGYENSLSESNKELIVIDCSRYPINFAKALKKEIFARPNATLFGLNYILEYNE